MSLGGYTLGCAKNRNGNNEPPTCLRWMRIGQNNEQARNEQQIEQKIAQLYYTIDYIQDRM